MNYPKFRFTTLPLLAACVFSLSPERTHAAVNFTAGDLLVGFQATGGVGAGSTYVFNLGQAYNYRDNASVGFVANLSTDLSAVFGAGWYTRTDVNWSIGGVHNNATFGTTSTMVVNGDPSRAIYASKESSGIGTTTPHPTLAAGSINTTANKMFDSQSGFRTTNGTIVRDATATSGGNGVIQGTGDINNWATIVPVNTAPWTTQPTSVTGNFGTGAATTNLDLYRALSNNSNLAGVAEPSATGVYTYQTTFTIGNTGLISAVPEPSTSLLGGIVLGAALLRRRRSA